LRRNFFEFRFPRKMERQAKVEFDYTADEKESNQLSIKTGESITLIGDVTDGGWVLARNANGDEGYIPDQYFTIKNNNRMTAPQRPIKTSSSSQTSNDYEQQLTTNDTNKGSIAYSDVGGNQIRFSGVMESRDTYHLYAYQLEWFGIIVLFLGSLFTFGFATKTAPRNQWRIYISSFLAIIATIFTTIIIGFKRNDYSIKGSTALVRAILFIIITVLLAVAWPVGPGFAVLACIVAIWEFIIYKKQCQELPSTVTDEWRGQVFGGIDQCEAMRFIIFFTGVIVSCGFFGWGFYNGYNYATTVIQTINTTGVADYLQPVSTATMYGFGRIITCNLALILLFSLKKVILCCSKCKDKIMDKCKCCQKCKGKSDTNNSLYIHRVFGYSIIGATLLHMISAYYVYEESSPTHDYMDVYGWSSILTGFAALILLALILGSANETIERQNRRLFKQTHWLSVILMILLIAHGPQSANGVSTFYWQIMIAPFILYFCDVFTRYATSN